MEMMAYIISVTHIKCVTSISYSSILQKGKGVDNRNPPPPPLPCLGITLPGQHSEHLGRALDLEMDRLPQKTFP